MKRHGLPFGLTVGWTATLVAVTISMVAACASAERGTTGEEERIDVTIENNLQPPTSVTVWIGEQIGVRRMLGDVGPLETRTLSFRTSVRSGTYRLVARTTSGAEMVSDPFTAFAGEGVRWQLSGNIIEQ